MNKSLKVILASGLLLSGMGAVMARGMTEQNDALIKPMPKISLAQAIAAAEQGTGGKARQVDYEVHNGQWKYDIEVVSGSRVLDVAVNPDSGVVMTATEDTNDSDDEKDAKD